jgi:hypothetical protein
MEEAEHVPPGGRGEAPRPCGWSFGSKSTGTLPVNNFERARVQISGFCL